MSDCVKKRSNKAFDAIIRCKDASVTRVISDPVFRSRLKSANKLLIDYLNSDKIITEICDWLLSEKYLYQRNYKSYAQSMIKIFCDCPDSVLLIFSQNSILIEHLQNFCKFENPRFCMKYGFFVQLMDILINGTRGSFIRHFDDLAMILSRSLNVISIRYLFGTLSTNFPQAFGFNKKVVIQLLNNLNDENKDQTMLLLGKLVKDKSTFFAFDNSKVIFSLLEIATSQIQSEFVIIQSLQIVDCVKKSSIIVEKIDLILKYFASKIDFDFLPINKSTALILKIFKIFVPSLVLSMINNPTHMFMHEGILSTIENASDKILIPFIEENNIPTKIMWAMNVAKSNGFLTKFASILESKKELSKSLQTPEWNNFVNNCLENRLNILNRQVSDKFVQRRKSRTQQKKQAQAQALSKQNKPPKTVDNNKASNSENNKSSVDNNTINNNGTETKGINVEESKNPDQESNPQTPLQEQNGKEIEVEIEKDNAIEITLKTKKKENVVNLNENGFTIEQKEKKLIDENPILESKEKPNKTETNNKSINTEFLNIDKDQSKEKQTSEKLNVNENEDSPIVFEADFEDFESLDDLNNLDGQPQYSSDQVQNEIDITLENETKPVASYSKLKFLKSDFIENIISQNSSKLNENKEDTNPCIENKENNDQNEIFFFESIRNDSKTETENKENTVFLESNENVNIKETEISQVLIFLNENEEKEKKNENEIEIIIFLKENKENEIGNDKSNEDPIFLIPLPANPDEKLLNEDDIKCKSSKITPRSPSNKLKRSPIKARPKSVKYEPSTPSNDHYRISLLKKKFSKNQESDASKSNKENSHDFVSKPRPKSEKVFRYRPNLSNSFSDFGLKDIGASGSDSPDSKMSVDNDNNSIPHENTKDSNNEKEASKIQQTASNINIKKNLSLMESHQGNHEVIQTKRKNANQIPKKSRILRVLDIGDDFSSSSDDDEDYFVHTKNANAMAITRKGYYRHSIFGPVFVPNLIEESSSSDSDDEEFEFKFAPVPQRMLRRNAVRIVTQFDMSPTKDYNKMKFCFEDVPDNILPQL
ncbi:hypothetical protein TRFO_06286 [Tritrichomonas foetus]|uniref:Uncharacterized protein n=1 Tax=Tritrichomonas foetus TaxID=1144522 RepID=A0A1J4K0V2_9EUKA|nr:hypothetical protein TRFO_06286 [Tritrichomonas foetus]|eukprot:OHT04408.1 hypothetical protein TRFO_06286 [Tritrichomonas foetus]